MGYSVEEVCAIIKACKENGVGRLAIGDLKLSFASRVSEPEKQRILTPEELEQSREYQKQVFLENEQKLREDELANLRLSDPELYEELIARGELEHARKESDGIDAG